LSDQWLLETIKAKSDQLNACDLVGGPITVIVQKVSKLAGEQPVSIEIGEGRQPFKPCKNMRRVLIACWGTERWVGRSMTLYCDTNVKFGGQQVGGIRISHVSHIDVAKEIPLTASKGKSQVWTVQPLPTRKMSVDERIAAIVKAIGETKTKAELDAGMEQCKKFYDTLTVEQQAKIDDAKLAKGF